MFAIEFVTDKVPLLDSTWDLLHTAIRPAIGSLIGVSFADLDKVTGPRLSPSAVPAGQPRWSLTG